MRVQYVCILLSQNKALNLLYCFKRSQCFSLQELIQNAEDAGATEVKFLYDETEYGVESLWSHDMAQYQGRFLLILTDYSVDQI